MSMKITFDLSSADLDHFREVMSRAREAASELDIHEIVDRASQLLEKVNRSDTSDFVRDRMSKLETLIGMVVDQGWGLEDEERKRVVDALAYFAEAEDLIPDHIPGLGFLDDAIMIEMVVKELRHEIQAYRDFVVYRAAEACRLGDEAGDLERSDWLEERRQQLHSRMRRRRRRGRGDEEGKKSPFSLL